MTLRDWFAGQALISLAAVNHGNDWGLSGKEHAPICARRAYKIADAMLRQRGVTVEGGGGRDALSALPRLWQARYVSLELLNLLALSGLWRNWCDCAARPRFNWPRFEKNPLKLHAKAKLRAA